MSRSKAKGTAAETALVAALRRLGWPHAERLALSGAKDKGDTTGHPGIVFECKDARIWQASAWLRETEVERVNANAAFGVLVIKVPGIGYPNAEKWLTVMEDEAAKDLVYAADTPRMLAQWPLLSPLWIRSVELGAVGVARGLAELKERERHCGSTPVMVRVRKKSNGSGKIGFYNLMRLDSRCRLLVDAGFGERAIMDAGSPSTLGEHHHG